MCDDQPALERMVALVDRWDFCHVNHIIATTIDGVQDQVVERYSPAMDLLDKLLGPLDEWGAARMITHWRDEVWQNVEQWLATDDAAKRAVLHQKVEAAAFFINRSDVFHSP